MGAGHYQLLTSKAAAGIAVVRVWGTLANQFLKRHTRIAAPLELGSGVVRRTALVDSDGEPVDDIIVSTGRTSAEPEYWLHLHGNSLVIDKCCALARECKLVDSAAPVWQFSDGIECDAYQILPNVLTLRGATWLLDQIARVRDACAAVARCDDLKQAQAACRELLKRRNVITWFTQPLRVSLVGPPNAGKSSLMNALGDQTASVVSAEPGTTRDWVEVLAELDGFPVAWIDTAGLRSPSDEVEAAGITRTQGLLAETDATVLVLDRTDPAYASAVIQAWPGEPPDCVALNKLDLDASSDAVHALLPAGWATRTVDVSSHTGVGLDDLRVRLLGDTGRRSAVLDHPAAFCDRQVRLCTAAAQAESCNALRSIMFELTGSNRNPPAGSPHGLPQSAG